MSASRLVGGCCGTTPEHIHGMKSRLRGRRGARHLVQQGAKLRRPIRSRASALGERSRLGRKIADGEFVTMVEIVPPKGIDAAKEIEGARFLKSVGVDAVNIPDSPRASARMSNQALCLLIAQQVGIEPILHYTCRDRNVLGIQSDLLGASAIGIRNLICITGDPPKMGDYPDATAVFDVDAIGLVNIVHNLNRGLDIGGNPIGNATRFVIAVGANPGSRNIDEEIRRFEYKVEAGAEFAVTQPVFDLRLLEEFLTQHRALPHSGGRRHLAADQRAQCRVHEERAARFHSRRDHRAHGQGQHRRCRARRRRRHRPRHARRRARAWCRARRSAAPFGRYSCAVDVLEALGTAAKGGA